MARDLLALDVSLTALETQHAAEADTKRLRELDAKALRGQSITAQERADLTAWRQELFTGGVR